MGLEQRHDTQSGFPLSGQLSDKYRQAAVLMVSSSGLSLRRKTEKDRIEQIRRQVLEARTGYVPWTPLRVAKHVFLEKVMETELKVQPGIIIQARVNSGRLPLKCLFDLNGSTMLQHVIRRAKSSGYPVVLATPDNSGWLARICQHEGIGPPYVYPDEDDVLGRYYHCALTQGFDPIMRVTGDCPLIEGGVIKDLFELQKSGGFDIVGTARGETALSLGFKRRFPDGLDAECLTLKLLEWLHNTVQTGTQYREHVTRWAWEGAASGTADIKYDCLEAPDDYDWLKLSVDTEEDYELMEVIYKALGDNARWKTVVRSRARILKSTNLNLRSRLYSK